MIDKWNTLLLQLFSWNVTDVTLVLLIGLKLLILSSETSKCIKHDTWHDVTEQQTEECNVYHVIGESHHFKSAHGLTDNTRHEQLHQAFEHCFTHLTFISFSIHVLHVVAESNCTENKHKCNTQSTDVQNTLDADGNGSENVSKVWVVAENINDVNEEQWWMEESTQEGNSHVKNQTIEIYTLKDVGSIGPTKVKVLLDDFPVVINIRDWPQLWLFELLNNPWESAGSLMIIFDLNLLIQPFSGDFWCISGLSLRFFPNSKLKPIKSVDTTHGQLN